MPLATRLTRMLGIKYPIVQGGMHYVGYAEMAAAVSNAGGLGTITALTITSPDALQVEIRKCRALLRDPSTPIAVNMTLLPMLAPPDYPAYAAVVVEEKIPVVETAGHINGLAEFIDLFSANGIKVMHKCVAVRHALKAQKLGADIISMDGFDCAGHPGEMDVGNWILFAQAARALDIPFIASGGCADGKQLAAALALGADGMNMGTRFMATQEAPIHENIKQALVEGGVDSTHLVMRSHQNTERVYANEASAKVLAIEKEDPGGDFKRLYPFVAGDNYRKSFQETGDTQSSVWSAGHVMGLIDDVPTCDELLRDIVDEAEVIMRDRLPAMLVDAV